MAKAKIPLTSPSLPPKKKSKTGTMEKASVPSLILPKVDVKGKRKATAVQTNTSPAGPAFPSTFKIIAGSYEKLLYGFEGSFVDDGSESLELKLKPIFCFPAHISCIKAVAASPDGGKWLATGSADEIIKVWDLRRKKEIGGLMHHEGSITHLSFPSRSHLISASEDGTLCLFRARDWSVLRALKGHKGRVNSLAVHPSGKVALSVGSDRTLRMWDLMRGKGAASTKLGKEGELVRWSTDGSTFVVQAHSTVDVYSTTMAMLHTITHPSRIQDVRYWKRRGAEHELLFVAGEDKKVSIYQLSSSEPEQPPPIIAEFTGHSNRVKGIDLLEVALPPSSKRPESSTVLASTVSSDGRVHVYDLSRLPAAFDPKHEKIAIEPSAVYDTNGTRLTCVAMAGGEAGQTSSLVGKRKRGDDAAEESDDGEDWAAQGAVKSVDDDDDDDDQGDGSSNKSEDEEE